MNGRWTCWTWILIAAAAAWASPADFKVEPTGACDRPGTSASVKASLQAEGLRVSDASGALCELWLRKAIPVDASASAGSYSAMAPGTFAGVIAYTGKGGDFRGQGIKPGVYTMRYALLPADGNHMGVSPTTDYFMLSPAEADSDPNVAIEYEKLLDLSRKASGTNHPGVIYLVAPAAPGKAGMRDLGDNHHALDAVTKGMKPGGGPEIDFPLAIVLVGKGEG